MFFDALLKTKDILHNCNCNIFNAGLLLVMGYTVVLLLFHK